MDQLPKIVRERLNVADAGAHPDPDLLAAFAEQALPDTERQAVVAHLALCDVCREVVSLAALAADRTRAGAAPAVSPDLVPRPPARRHWLPAPAWPWAALASVVILAAALAVRYESFPPRPSPPPAQPQTAREFSPARQRPALVAGAKKRGDVSNGLASAAPAAAPERANRELSASNAASSPSRKRAVPLTPALAQSLRSDKPSAAEDFLESAKPSQSALQKVPLSGASAGAAGGVAGGGRAPLVPQVAAKVVQEISAAAPYEWTLSGDGVLERSADSGKTWTKIEVGNGVRFRALSALGSDVWAGGADGLLFHSPDAGAHWTRVFPVSGGVALAATISRIEFADPLHGRLVTAAGEVWLTADAGRTWQRR